MNPIYIVLIGLAIFGLIFILGKPYKYSQKIGTNLESNYFGPLLAYRKISSKENLVALKSAGIAYWKDQGFSQKEAEELTQNDLDKILK